jgi:hypothetical protein
MRHRTQPVPVSPGPKGARTPPSGGDKKIKKPEFGFKGVAQFFCDPATGKVTKTLFRLSDRGTSAWPHLSWEVRIGLPLVRLLRRFAEDPGLPR